LPLGISIGVVSKEIAEDSADQNLTESTIDKAKVKNEKLKDLLADLDLTPEQTRDDIAISDSRDNEILRDIPPHHGA
jgi:hypothetical protein